jgi:hypothetical protein
MKKHAQLLLIGILAFGFAASCNDEESEGAMTMASITPASAVPGTSVTIKGKNFGTVAADITVKFGLANGTVTLAANDSLKVTVPTVTTFGPVAIVITKEDKSVVGEFTIDDPNAPIVLQGNLTTSTLDASKKYLIRGQVFINNGVVVTVPAGTKIFGEKRTKGTLVVNRGGRLIADGTAANPIVMTSDQPAGIRDRGDWGGLVILGNAATNQIDPTVEGISPSVFFGGNAGNTSSSNTAQNTENSGTYRYLRVEFAGIELSPNNETNSITLGGVGSGTIFENVMVSFGGDDGFEWFGGTVNGKNLISFATWDDDFDVDFGWSGNVQFGLVIRYPGFADQSQSNGFETDNGPNDNDVQPYTTGVFSNVTVLGPIKTGSSVSNANYAHAIDARRRTALSIFNSVFTGFPIGVRFNQASVRANYDSGLGVFANNVLFAPSVNNSFRFTSGTTQDTLIRNYWNGSNTSVIGAFADAAHTTAGINPDWFFGSRLADAYPATPNFTVAAGTTIASGASFTNAKFSETNRTTFFDKTVAFRGAFGTTNWASTWAEFNPVSKAY